MAYTDEQLLSMISSDGGMFTDTLQGAADLFGNPFGWGADDEPAEEYTGTTLSDLFERAQERERQRAADRMGIPSDPDDMTTLPPYPGETGGLPGMPGIPYPQGGGGYGADFAGPVDPGTAQGSGWLAQVAAQIVRSGITGQALAALARMLLAKSRGTEALTGSCAKIMAEQLTGPQRQAVYQWLCGMRAPMGLSEQGQQTFLAIKLATSGLPPETCGCS